MPVFERQQNRSQRSSHLASPVRLDRADSRLAPMRNSFIAQQQSLGNQAVQRLLRSRVIQTKLTINDLGDRYEQEADRVADAVMRMPDPSATRGTAVSQQTQGLDMHRMCSECEEELYLQPTREETLQAKEIAGRTTLQATPDMQSQLSVVRSGGGKPLPESVRSFFEPRFGYDFSQVRLHTDARAAETAQVVNARAFTIGQDMVFGAREYAPGTMAGRNLLAHELAHVTQHAPQNRISRAPEEPRQVAATELAVPPAPTATVILVGSPTDQSQGFDKSPHNFSNAAVAAVPKLKSDLPGTDVTILYFSPGYLLRGKAVHDRALKDLNATGASVIEVTTSKQVIDFLNTGLISPVDFTPTRAVKVSRFYYFGHGTADTLLLNWGWGNKAVSQSLNKNEIANIKSEAFDPVGRSYLFTCHIAEGENSFMSVWASHLGQTSTGAQGNAAFNAKYDANDLANAINKELPKWFLGMPYLNKVKVIDPAERKTGE